MLRTIDNNKNNDLKKKKTIWNKITLHKEQTKATAEKRERKPENEIRKIERSELDYEKCRWIIKKMHW